MRFSVLILPTNETLPMPFALGVKSPVSTKVFTTSSSIFEVDKPMLLASILPVVVTLIPLGLTR